MDKIVKKILEEIDNEGFESYVVGGYVRDYLLGIKSYDVDICTSALPKDIYRLFNTGSMNHYGENNIKVKKFNIDITTFREESEYINRHPVEVKYVNDLKSDLLRRDFTINTICMDKKGQVIDLLNGMDDLNARVIRVIGDAQKRLQDDPLRILRAIRIATVLDFDIDEVLLKEIKNNAKLVNTLSKERIKGEVSKILMSPNFLKGLNWLKEFNIDKLIGLRFNEINYCNDILGMYSQIDINLNFTKEEQTNIIKIKEVLKKGSIDSYTLYKYGPYVCTVAGTILNYKISDINKMYNELPINEKKDIALGGAEISSILNIKPSKVLKTVINDLEFDIINGKVKNQKDELSEYIILNKSRWIS